MPSKEDHLALAAHNKRAIEHLLDPQRGFPDWAATVAFYTAVHFVEALFAHEHPMEHGRNHQIREGLLRSNRRYDEIWKHYRPLKDASCVARYLASGQGTEYRTFADYATIDQVRREFVDHRLRHIEASVLKLIASPPDGKNRNR